jgi:hypothetical protein
VPEPRGFVLIAEVEPEHAWQRMLQNQRGAVLARALRRRTDAVVCRMRVRRTGAQRALCGMSRGRPAVSYRSVVPLDTLCGTYGLADEIIGSPADAPESGTPA